MKRQFLFQCITSAAISVLCAASLSSSVFAQFSNERGEYLFTFEEAQIIERQRAVMKARGVREDGPPEYIVGIRASRKGGSGSARWAVFNVGSDEFGNRYEIDTRQATPLGQGRSHFLSWLSGAHYPVWRVRFDLQITFVSPTDRGGAVRRHVTLETECPGVRHDQIQNFTLKRLSYHDYGSNGALLATRQFNGNVERLNEKRWFEYSILRHACEAAYSYPRSVRLLVQGQNPTGNQSPSFFD